MKMRKTEKFLEFFSVLASDWFRAKRFGYENQDTDDRFLKLFLVRRKAKYVFFMIIWDQRISLLCGANGFCLCLTPMDFRFSVGPVDFPPLSETNGIFAFVWG